MKIIVLFACLLSTVMSTVVMGPGGLPSGQPLVPSSVLYINDVQGSMGPSWGGAMEPARGQGSSFAWSGSLPAVANSPWAYASPSGASGYLWSNSLPGAASGYLWSNSSPNVASSYLWSNSLPELSGGSSWGGAVADQAYLWSDARGLSWS